jgi:MscS family membrane protein
MLHLTRWVVNLLILFGGVFVTLHYFGVNPAAALAGVGVGGIAVAFAAQKTLENIIGGVSLIFDQAVRVGDILKVGETSGTVADIGLRSIRIRTPDRTVVSVPNGQIANMTLENISSRDKFWFHPVLALRYGTTSQPPGRKSAS